MTRRSSSSPLTIGSREFTRDVAAAKTRANDGPVVITDRGEPSHVLMSIVDYRRLTRKVGGLSLLDAMRSLPSTAGIDFEPPARDRAVARPLPGLVDG